MFKRTPEKALFLQVATRWGFENYVENLSCGKLLKRAPILRLFWDYHCDIHARRINPYTSLAKSFCTVTSNMGVKYWKGALTTV